ncbi:hypothetical protein Y032_0044g978 [Ancylostoma ceylanicum]|uniref:Uncharacterized protein n=1 Tax=Ancylostoma ceylanicum TaxID=53326 RepID=A0A016UER4_9BILA|nr:hypothetical protein Y032_0044g978 [Ancylostoma ceylanicum]
MQLLNSAFFLAVVCHGLNEQDIPKELKKNFDKDKLIIPVSNQYGEEFYANVTIRAFTAVVHSLAEERMAKLPLRSKLRMQQCLKLASDLTEKAKCLVALMQKLRSMKTRSRNTLLRRIEIQSIRRRRQKRWIFSDKEKNNLSSEKTPLIVSNGSYELISEKGTSLPRIFAFHMRKTAAHLRGGAKSPQRGWRSLTRELASYREKIAIRERLTSLLSSGMNASLNGLPQDGYTSNVVPREQQDKPFLHQLNALITKELGRRKRAAWGAYKSIEDVLKKTKNIRLRAHLLNTTVLPALTYASETWALRKQDDGGQRHRTLHREGDARTDPPHFGAQLSALIDEARQVGRHWIEELEKPARQEEWASSWRQNSLETSQAAHFMDIG